MLKLHLIDSLSTCYTAICARNSENRTDGAYALKGAWFCSCD